MKTCRGCPHIDLDRWPQGKIAVRCLYTGNGDRFGRVLHVVRDEKPSPPACGCYLSQGERQEKKGEIR